MFQLIYYSIAIRGLSSQDIFTILKDSRVCNSKKNITGCLLCHDDAFLQILEGGKEDIEHLFCKIDRDPRHYNVKVLHRDYTQDRVFKNWEMAFYDLGNNRTFSDKLIFRENFMAATRLTEQPGEALQLFVNIAQQMLEA